jgi:adenosylhomocysteinase
VEYLVQNRGKLDAGVYVVPRETDQEVGRLKLQAMGIHIDTLTAEQQRYQESWEEGT